VGLLDAEVGGEGEGGEGEEEGGEDWNAHFGYYR
jgi:hypothetical protein